MIAISCHQNVQLYSIKIFTSSNHFLRKYKNVVQWNYEHQDNRTLKELFYVVAKG